MLLKRALIISVVLFVGRAHALDGKACVVSANDAAKLRADGKLRAARDRAIECADPSCPDVVRSECVKLAESLADEVPTFVPSATDDAGNDLVDVAVTLDGVAVASKLDGRAFEADPGEHVLELTRAGQTVKTTIVLKTGEKRRIVRLAFAAPKPLPPKSIEIAPIVKPIDRKPVEATPVAPWILGGASVVLAGAGVWLQLTTTSRAHELRDTCAPYCDDGDVSKLRTRYWISGGLYAGAALALGGALYLGLSRERATVAISPQGAAFIARF